MLQGLDRYLVIKQLGKGLYTEIFQAVDKTSNAMCALKAMYMD